MITSGYTDDGKQCENTLQKRFQQLLAKWLPSPACLRTSLWTDGRGDRRSAILFFSYSITSQTGCPRFLVGVPSRFTGSRTTTVRFIASSTSFSSCASLIFSIYLARSFIQPFKGPYAALYAHIEIVNTCSAIILSVLNVAA